MKLYQFKVKQLLSMSLDKAWFFFSDPKNLSKLTPQWLNLKITSDLPNEMYEGMIISYKVHPVLGIPINWVTEITSVEEKKYFIDEQRFGPYKLWHHQHHFKEIDGGIEMEDIVNYALPFDPFSRPFNTFLVEKKIRTIFEFREGVLKKLFSN
jgi:ligand-binding SRPBCC domain-containing protein